MLKRWICGCMALLLRLLVFAQVTKPVLPVEALLHTRKPVTINWRDNAFTFNDTPYNRFHQELLKTKDGLFLFVNGSGRLYRLLEKDSSIQLQRIDSTFYSGYNHGSFAFVYHDSIYSLGGYGIWRINGQLRVYIPQAYSWDIVPLNEEIPVLMQEEYHDLLWYNEQSARLYIGYSIVRNQAVKHSSLNEAAFDYTVRSLDLRTKDWQVVGALNEYFKDKVALIRNIAFTPWGQLVAFGNKLLLIDYANNRLLHMQEEAENKIRPILFQHPTTNLYYCIDSTLYFGHIAENRLSSLPLHFKDFTDAGITVYTVPVSRATIITWITGAAALLLVALFIWKRRKYRTALKHMAATTGSAARTSDEEMQAPVTEAGITTAQPPKLSIPFDERELQVIQLILSNNRQSLPTAIEDVNAVLGLTKKNIDTQKNQRSAVLKSINSKYSNWQNTTDKLIESKQVETDKRSRVYIIPPDKQVIVMKMLAVYTQND